MMERRLMVSAVALAVTLSLLACNLSAALTPKGTTSTPTAEASATLPATQVGTPQVISVSPMPTTDLQLQPYAHASGAFSVSLPQDWEPVFRSDGLYAATKDGNLSADFSVVNCGVKLDEKQLNAYIDAIEKNWFSTFEGYVVNSRQTQSNGSIRVVKTLNTSPGVTFRVASYFLQIDKIIYEQDYWALAYKFDFYLRDFTAITATFTPNAAAAEMIKPYQSAYRYKDENQRVAFSVPYSWARDHQAQPDNSTYQDTFTAPDQRSFIRAIIFPKTGGLNADQALQGMQQTIHSAFAQDAVFGEAKTQEDGTVLLDWISQSSGIRGSTLYYASSDAFWLVSFVTAPETYDLYSPVFTHILDTYEISPLE